MDSTLIFALLGALLAATLAVLLAWSEKRSPAYWCFIGGMAVLVIEAVLAGMTSSSISLDHMARWQRLRVLCTAFVPLPWLAFSLTYARAEAEATLIKWRHLVGALACFPIVTTLLFVVFGNRSIIWNVHNVALSSQLLFDFGAVGLVISAVFLASAIFIVTNLERTYRSAAGKLRWRLKYMILGLALLFLVRGYSASQELLFRGTTLSVQAINSDALLIACLLMGASLFRAGQLELKVYPSQFVLHQSIVAVIAGAYLLVMLMLVRLVNYLTGSRVQSIQLALLLLGFALLGLLLCSDKVRLYARQVVSRHFQRPQYDYRAVWRAFADCTTRHMDEKELCGAIAKLVSDLFQSLSVTIWLTEDGRKHFGLGASTSLTTSGAVKMKPGSADSLEIIQALAANSEPLDLDLCEQRWAVLLRRLHPVQTVEGGDRLCAPLVAHGEVVGVLMLGERVGGARFSTQEFELLKSVSDQAAASLLNLQLAQRLAQSRQLEAFQSMSAFFVHDLKNTASTLSLMLQNLPVHFDKPAFREDALRGVSKTVDHINELIRRVGMLRQELALQPSESDLNQVVSEALKDLGTLSVANVVTELQPVPRVRVDPLQIRNVVTNLVLNARDAVKPGGEIRIETTRENGWVIVGVKDDGCGMSTEFKNRMLFKPFQTTKKEGIGIGMFQCKMIVEAHHGKIEVESEVGKGTAFRVFLPVG